MIYEFALDPEVLDNWKDVRYFLDKFGVSQGRLISRFPKKWERMVHEACAIKCLPVEKSKIQVALSKIKKNKIISSNRDYAPTLGSWLINAEVAHQEAPFRAILSRTNPRNITDVLVADEVEDNPLWKVNRESIISRDADSLGKAVEPLLKISREIHFVDPHFDLKKRFEITLVKFISIAITDKDERPSFEYHTTERECLGSNYKEAFKSKIQPLLDNGVRITFKIWEGEFHARYILTERGGIRIDAGLDQSLDGNKTDISLMDEDVYQARMKEYQKETSPYKLVDEFQIIGIGTRSL